MARRYYVIFADDEWKVKLQEGPVLSCHGSDRRGAINEAKRLGRNQNRPVMVNYKSGATGAEYHSAEDL
jgi:hypothetical protein